MNVERLFLNSGYRPFCLFFIIDDSASMSYHTETVRKGFMNLIDSLKKHPLFADSYVRVTSLHKSIEIAEPLERVNNARIMADGGNTPLYDTIGDSLDELKSYQTAVEDRGYKYRAFFGVLTDGEDNASDTYSRDEIVAKINQLRKDGLTAFIGIDLGNVNSDFYMDAGFKVVKDSRDLGLMFNEVQEFLENQVAGLLPAGKSPAVIRV
jgi:uncharacterized protein YegL